MTSATEHAPKNTATPPRRGAHELKPAGGGAHSFSGTWQLIRLALRRDRVVLPIWIVVLGIIPAGTVGTYESLYPTVESRAPLTAGLGANPSVNLLYGPAFDLSTAGGYTAWKYGTILPLLLALACVFTVTRHTRQEEDTGRLELLASAVVGRYAALTAAVSVAGAASLVTGLIMTAGLLGVGLPAAGSVVLGLGAALTGWVFAGVAAIAAQLAEFSRTANGIGSAVLGAMFLIRALGDSAKDVSWLSWLSPIGWATQLRSFAGERWWVLLLPLAAAVVLTGIGYALLPRRDVGMGIMPTRPGPATAARSLASPFALAWRLHRGVLLGWVIGFAIVGGVFGSLAAGVGDVIGGSDQTKQIVERMGGSAGLVDSFVAAILGIFGMVASLYAVQATLRMRSEETALRVEPLLATKVGRLRWAAGHLVFAVLGSALLVLVAGAASGLFHGLRVHDVGTQLPHALGAAAAQIPAIWVVAGAAVLLFGFAPKLSSAGWAVAALFLAISMFGPIANASQVVLDISPFSHIPKLPSAPFTATPLLWLTGVAIAAFVAGLTAFRRRDI
ncbi:ABC transporter permease [Amycolatopsis minnesotensis]|uniref:Exporter of polyketide antibiotics n=1 Tax=Amycolatopsis minnesotensis TaxID=337894 RepID=A0ABP5DIP3_9PSEU